MMRSLFSGVAGLKSHQTRMDTVGNNISNVNTYGFKSSRTTFADTLYQTLSGASAPTGKQGGTNPKQIGLGTGVASIDTIFTDGSVQSTGKNTDLCLSGSGLFVVKNGSGTYYTRDGAFEFDKQGNYVLPGSGLLVQGWTASGAGDSRKVDATGDPGNISIVAGKSMAATATTKMYLENNLNADAAVNDTATVTATVYDAEGGAHSLSITAKKTAANTWSMTPVTTLGDGTTVAGTILDLVFNTDGSYKSGGAGTLTLTYPNGATAGSVAVAATKTTTSNGVTTTTSATQYSGSDTIKAAADGNAAGTLKSVSIDSSGVITGTYTNGISQAEAQVAIAQFNNPAGLTKTGSNLYQVSNNSGDPSVKKATDLGVSITPSALEMSNVDLSNEFSDMIITQRGFQSNSKIITVSDEMLETLVNMKR